MSKREPTQSGKDDAPSSADAQVDAVLGKLNRAGMQVNDPRVRAVAGAALAIFRQIEWEESKQPMRARHFPFAFKVGESYLQRLEGRVVEMLNEAPPLVGAEIQFSAEVRYPDLSTERFFSMNELLQKAGDRSDPERLRLNWQQFAREPVGSRVQIEAVFTTEKPLKTEELGLLDFPIANMDAKVTGCNSNWVESTFEALLPFFDTARLRGIYRPLLLFRNRMIVHMVGLSLGLVGWILFHEAISNVRRAEAAPTRESFVQSVKALPSIEQKFDKYVEHLHGPLEINSLYETLFVFVGGIVCYLMIFACSLLFLPKLAPRSGINIGLATTRYDQWENAFRLIVFTLLLSGVVIPLLLRFVF